MQKVSYSRHRFPPHLILHPVWPYARFTLSCRDVEDLLAERGVDISYETVRRWYLKFGTPIARNLRSSRHAPYDIWHLDEMVVVIRGKRHCLWRAIDSEGEVPDFLVQPKRNAKTALKSMRKLLKKQGFAPRKIITDKLRSYHTAFRALGLRAENSHLPVRQRERKMQRFKSPGSAQRFLNIQSATYNNFYVQHHLVSQAYFKQFREEAFDVWATASAVN